MNIVSDPRLGAVADAHPYPLLFATVSGAHLYGFASADSDVDLRGVHVLRWREVVGLEVGPDTIERMGDESGLDLDLVTHDAAKFFRLMLRPNGYVLEQLFSPLVVRASATLEELRALGEGCVTRWHSRHYLGFAATQWRLFRGDQPRRVKPLLYTYRGLLTGIRLMRTGKVEANLRALNEEARLSHVDDLIALKVGGAEKEEVGAASVEFHAAEYARLRELLEREAQTTNLPEQPSVRRGLHALLVELRRDAARR